MNSPKLPEPWLRGTHTDVPPAQRAVLHALELAKEDIEKWCGDLVESELNARPFGIASVAFHIRHIAGSCDRLLTYAEGKQLSEQQIETMQLELEPGIIKEQLFFEFNGALAKVAERVRTFRPDQFEETRGVGKKQLPTTVAGLLVHIADHTQRHVGQAITTAKLIKASTERRVASKSNS